MRHGICLALSPTNLGVLEKVLAIAGGAALGALLVGFLTQLLCRAVTTRKVPLGLLFLIRLLGAIVFGWLVALLVFGDDHWGIGGPGGLRVGAEAGKGAQSATDDAGKKSESKKPDESPLEPSADSLRVEVLSDSALKAIAGDKPFDPERCYRAEDKGRVQLLTLPQLKEFIKQRRQQNPALRRLEIVLYKDSPARNTPYVSDLENWARELPVNEKEMMEVDVSSRGQKSPTR